MKHGSDDGFYAKVNTNIIYLVLFYIRMLVGIWCYVVYIRQALAICAEKYYAKLDLTTQKRSGIF